MSFYRRQVCDCGKPLLWARTERNRWIPLDPKPNPDGNQAAWEDSDGVWKTRQIGKNSDPPWDFERMFMPHVGTCELVKERREAARQASQPAGPGERRPAQRVPRQAPRAGPQVNSPTNRAPQSLRRATPNRKETE